MNIFLSLFFYILIFVPLAQAQSPVDFAALANQPIWAKLLHYHPHLGLIGKGRSLADGPMFFLAENGKKNLQDELLANIAAIESYQRGENKSYGRLKTSYPCTFPARFQWLNQVLKLNIPRPTCKDYDWWRDQLPVNKVQIIFASYYANNPASFFGHTFLKLGLEKNVSNNVQLLDYIVDFSASTDTDHGIEFALRGLFGGYPGIYSLKPYYMKINEYHHNESRDLWEYEIPLNKLETERMLAHLWEMMQTTWFDYYFLDENCSFQLLQLLEVAKEDWTLTKGFYLFAMPIDTVRSILAQQNGGIEKYNAFHYRPSFKNLTMHNLNQLSPEEKTRVINLISNKNNEIELEQEIKIFENAIALLRFRRFEQKAKKEDELHVKNLLIKRATLGHSDKGQVNIQMPRPPHLAHNTSMVNVSYGASYLRKEFLEFSLRPALSDWGNDHRGLQHFSETELVKITANHNLQADKTDLRNLILLNVKSLQPYKQFDRETSWMLDLSIIRDEQLSPQIHGARVGKIRGGPGISVNLFNDNSIFYAMALINSEFSNAHAKGLTLGPGHEIGIMYVIDKQKFGIRNLGQWDLLNVAETRWRNLIEVFIADHIFRNFELRMHLGYKNPIKGFAPEENFFTAGMSYFF
jgi:hypothetical protein